MRRMLVLVFGLIFYAGIRIAPGQNLQFSPVQVVSRLIQESVSTGYMFTVSNATPYGSTLDISFVVSNSWISLAFPTGQIPNGGVFTNWITNSAVGLTGADYYSHVRVFCNGTTSAAGTEVVLYVLGLDVSPMQITNSIMHGGQVETQEIKIVATGTGGLGMGARFDAQVNFPWITVTPSTGYSSYAFGVPANTNILQVSYNSTTLTNGSYTGLVDLVFTGLLNAAGCATQTVRIITEVMDMQFVPESLSNSIMQGFNAPAEVFYVTNAGGGTFDYDALVTEGAQWLSVFPASGACCPLGGAPETNIYNTTGLLPGIYTGIIQVASTNGGGKTNDMNVLMRMVGRPVIEYAPAQLTQVVERGLSPTGQFFAIRNGSLPPVAPMAYAFSVTNKGVALIQNLSSGSGVSTGQADSIFVSFTDLSGLEVGIYTAGVIAVARDIGSNYWPTGQVVITGELAVVVEITAPAAPANVRASRGTYTDYVLVQWAAVPKAASYRIYRGVTFDPNQVELIGDVVQNEFRDDSALPGVLYYYWLCSVNTHGGEGRRSVNRETGYRGLAAPGGVFATDGVFTNKVRVTWSFVDGAAQYRVYRAGGGIARREVYFTAGNSFDDFNAQPGVEYKYNVQATNAICAGTASADEIGYVFGIPLGFSASQGGYVGRVRLTWNSVKSALSYEVWRSQMPLPPPDHGAAKLGEVTGLEFNNNNPQPGVFYYYWVRAKSAELTGLWSGMARGYSATQSADLQVSDFVVLPARVALGARASVVSLRLRHGGGAEFIGSDATLGMEFFASTNLSFELPGKTKIGALTRTVPLRPGQTIVLNVPGADLRLPATAGDYYLYARVLPVFPSMIADSNPDNNVVRRFGALRVTTMPSINYQALNDYDGDGISDLAVYNGIYWSVMRPNGDVLGNNVVLFGGLNGTPVLGDIDGDHRSDPIIYRDGIWNALFSGRGYGWVSGRFGDVGYIGIAADYQGIGHAQISLYNQYNGQWYVLRTNGQLAETVWGGAGFMPVLGDYNGDGEWDLCVYETATGRWFIQTSRGNVLLSGFIWGAPGYEPVAGDFDGDGVWDLAVYGAATGKWFVFSLDGRTLVWDWSWGGGGGEPVFGDFDGNGASDLAIYNESTGRWNIRSLEGRWIARDVLWGGPGYRPVGKF